MSFNVKLFPFWGPQGLKIVQLHVVKEWFQSCQLSALEYLWVFCWVISQLILYRQVYLHHIMNLYTICYTVLLSYSFLCSVYIIIYLYIWFTYTRNIKKHMAFSLHGPLLGVRWVRLSHQSFEWPLLIPVANNSLLCPNCSDLHKRLLGCDRKPGCSGSLQQKRASSAPSGSERILTLFINSYAPWVRRSVPSHIS